MRSLGALIYIQLIPGLDLQLAVLTTTFHPTAFLVSGASLPCGQAHPEMDRQTEAALGGAGLGAPSPSVPQPSALHLSRSVSSYRCHARFFWLDPCPLAPPGAFSISAIPAHSGEKLPLGIGFSRALPPRAG